ncbi:DUF6531 domain-containing protein [Flaviaesturariibacter terrae]
MSLRATIFLLLLLAARSAFAGVNIKNGNFFITYTDIAFDGAKLDITRSYNSKSVDNGYFGFGWGSLLETRLFPLPDGTVAIRWWGSGSNDIMEAAVPDADAFYRMIDAVVQAEIRRNRLSNTPADLLRRRGELRSDRNKLYEQFLHNRQLGFIPQAATYRSALKRSWRLDTNRELSWDGRQFTLRSWADSYHFNADGLLTELTQDGGSMQIRYRGRHITEITLDKRFPCQVQTDTAGRIIRITTTDSGKVKTAVYRYDRNNDLVYSRDMGGNEYWHSYDASHNMTRIGYSDSTQYLIEYDPVTFFAIRVTERNGSSTRYQYLSFYNEWGEVNNNHYGTRIEQFDSLGTRIFNSSYEYENRVRGDGTVYFYHYVALSDTSEEENRYDPNVGNVAYRRVNGREAFAQYDGKSRCVYLRMNDSVFRVRYNVQDLPEQFVVIDSLRKDTLLYRYRYNSKGALLAVQKGTQLFNIQRLKDGDLRVSTGDTTVLLHYDGKTPVRASSRFWGDVDLVTEAKSPADRARQQWARAFADVVEPKIIPHEWVWERLRRK